MISFKAIQVSCQSEFNGIKDDFKMSLACIEKRINFNK